MQQTLLPSSGTPAGLLVRYVNTTRPSGSFRVLPAASGTSDHMRCSPRSDAPSAPAPVTARKSLRLIDIATISYAKVAGPSLARDTRSSSVAKQRRNMESMSMLIRTRFAYLITIALAALAFAHAPRIAAPQDAGAIKPT